MDGWRAVKRKLCAHLVAECVEPLRPVCPVGGDADVHPIDEEAAVGQRHDAGFLLQSRRGRVDQDVGGDRVPVIAQDRRANVVGFGIIGVGPHDDEAAVAQRGDVRLGFEPGAERARNGGDGNPGRHRHAGRSENLVQDVGVGRAAGKLVPVDRHEVAVGQRRELHGICTSG